jgi:hypothetical protein
VWHVVLEAFFQKADGGASGCLGSHGAGRLAIVGMCVVGGDKYVAHPVISAPIVISHMAASERFMFKSSLTQSHVSVWVT